MPKSVYTGAHSHIVDVLKEARHKAGLSQTDLAARVGKRQTYISLIEQSQRRVDVLEFYALAKAIGADPVELYAELVRRLPAKIDI